MTDEELIARLREIPRRAIREAHLAADRMEALVKERDRAWQEADAWSGKYGWAVRDKEAAEARIKRLETALRKIAEGNFIGRAEGYAFAALKGDDHA